MLSQSEVESLLALNLNRRNSSPSNGSIESRPSVAPMGGSTEPPGDRRPRFDASITERFLGGLCQRWAGMVRQIVDARLATSECAPYDDIFFEPTSTACSACFKVEGFDNRIVADFDAELLYPLLDRLLGGSGDSESVPKSGRPLTEIETRLAARVAEVVAKSLEGAVGEAFAGKISIENVDRHPRLNAVTPPTTLVDVHRFETAVAEARGRLRLSIPVEIGRHWVSDHESAPDADESQPGQSELRVTFQEFRLTAEELDGLAVGDTIVTTHSSQEPWLVSIDGRPTFRGTAGLIDGRKGVRIDARIADFDETSS